MPSSLLPKPKQKIETKPLINRSKPICSTYNHVNPVNNTCYKTSETHNQIKKDILNEGYFKQLTPVLVTVGDSLK